jgi:hypothetical protein
MVSEFVIPGFILPAALKKIKNHFMLHPKIQAPKAPFLLPFASDRSCERSEQDANGVSRMHLFLRKNETPKINETTKEQQSGFEISHTRH